MLTSINQLLLQVLILSIPCLPVCMHVFHTCTFVDNLLFYQEALARPGVHCSYYFPVASRKREMFKHVELCL